MSKRRLTMKALGAGSALFGVLLMLGTGGAVEAGTASVATAFLRMVIGCLAVLAGGALYGGLE